MSANSSTPSPTSGFPSDDDDDLTADLDLGFDGAEDLLRVWRQGMRPDPNLTVSEWADAASLAVVAGRGRAGAVSHRPRALSARDHGCAVARPPGAAHHLHEGRAGRRDRGWQQLDRLRDPSRAGADAGGAADGRDGQAHLARPDRSADRGQPGAARTGQPGPVARRGQFDAVEGISRRHPGADRGQLGDRPAVDARALRLSRRGRRLSGLGRRGRRSGHAGRGADHHLLAPAQGVHGLDARRSGG